MSGRGRGNGPAFSGKPGGGLRTNMMARDATFGGRGARGGGGGSGYRGGGRGGKFRKTLNGNYMSGGAKGNENQSTEESNAKVRAYAGVIGTLNPMRCVLPACSPKLCSLPFCACAACPGQSRR